MTSKSAISWWKEKITEEISDRGVIASALAIIMIVWYSFLLAKETQFIPWAIIQLHIIWEWLNQIQLSIMNIIIMYIFYLLIKQIYLHLKPEIEQPIMRMKNGRPEVWIEETLDASENNDKVSISSSLPSSTEKVTWNQSAAVMCVPPYGQVDIPNSDSSSQLIVHHYDGEQNVKIICNMGGLRPNSKYTIAIHQQYLGPSTRHPPYFSESIPREHFDTDSEGYGKKEFNIPYSEFNKRDIYTISVWVNVGPVGRTLLISNNFKVSTRVGD